MPSFLLVKYLGVEGLGHMICAYLIFLSSFQKIIIACNLRCRLVIKHTCKGSTVTLSKDLRQQTLSWHSPSAVFHSQQYLSESSFHVFLVPQFLWLPLRGHLWIT